jgi:hypothetical protein
MTSAATGTFATAPSRLPEEQACEGGLDFVVRSGAARSN